MAMYMYTSTQCLRVRECYWYRYGCITTTGKDRHAGVDIKFLLLTVHHTCMYYVLAYSNSFWYNMLSPLPVYNFLSSLQTMFQMRWKRQKPKQEPLLVSVMNTILMWASTWLNLLSWACRFVVALLMWLSGCSHRNLCLNLSQFSHMCIWVNLYISLVPSLLPQDSVKLRPFKTT